MPEKEFSSEASFSILSPGPLNPFSYAHFDVSIAGWVGFYVMRALAFDLRRACAQNLSVTRPSPPSPTYECGMSIFHSRRRGLAERTEKWEPGVRDRLFRGGMIFLG